MGQEFGKNLVGLSLIHVASARLGESTFKVTLTTYMSAILVSVDLSPHMTSHFPGLLHRTWVSPSRMVLRIA